VEEACELQESAVLQVALDRPHPQAPGHVLSLAVGEVEGPEAALVRLDEVITRAERRVEERETQLKRQQEQRRAQEGEKKARQACKEILGLLRHEDDDASVEKLRQAVEDEILDPSSIQTYLCAGIQQLARPVRLDLPSRSFINDEKYCAVFEVLIPHLSEDSIKQALAFAAKRSGLQHSQYKSYYPLLKPLLKGLPGIKCTQLTLNGHGKKDAGVHGTSSGEHLDLPILATIKHGGKTFLLSLVL
jgi:hypothetical protein